MIPPDMGHQANPSVQAQGFLSVARTCFGLQTGADSKAKAVAIAVLLGIGTGGLSLVVGGVSALIGHVLEWNHNRKIRQLSSSSNPEVASTQTVCNQLLTQAERIAQMPRTPAILKAREQSITSLANNAVQNQSMTPNELLDLAIKLTTNSITRDTAMFDASDTIVKEAARRAKERTAMTPDELLNLAAKLDTSGIIRSSIMLQAKDSLTEEAAIRLTRSR